MRKMRVLGAVFAVFCAVSLLAGCGAGEYRPVLKANWGLDLPDVRQVRETDSGPSFQGDGLRYHVFDCDGAAAAEALAAWSGREGAEAAGSEVEALAEEYLEMLAVPAAERPPYGSCLYWIKAGKDDARDRILLFLDGASGRLYTVESFM